MAPCRRGSSCQRFIPLQPFRADEARAELLRLREGLNLEGRHIRQRAPNHELQGSQVSDEKKTPRPRRQTKEEVSALARAAADSYQGIQGADQRSPREQLEAKLAAARAKLQSEHDRFSRYPDDDPRRLKYDADIQWATSKVRVLEEHLQRLNGKASERP
jgi:hypothetical protein